jgi:hypothetical protein
LTSSPITSDPQAALAVAKTARSLLSEADLRVMAEAEAKLHQVIRCKKRE